MLNCFLVSISFNRRNGKHGEINQIEKLYGLKLSVAQAFNMLIDHRNYKLMDDSITCSMEHTVGSLELSTDES